jgi:chromosomal replication initiation ATPase DnaA
MRTTPRAAAGVAADGGVEAYLAAAVAAARRVPVAAEVEEIVAAAGMTMADLRAPSRKREMMEVRRIVAAYLRRRGCSLPEIGRVLNRDHSTVLHLLRTTPRTETRCG